MKITIKQKELVQPEPIKLQDLEPGTVISFGKDEPIGLIVGSCNKKEIVLLAFYEGSESWCGLADGYKEYPIKRVLGKLTEIIVEPI